MKNQGLSIAFMVLSLGFAPLEAIFTTKQVAEICMKPRVMSPGAQKYLASYPNIRTLTDVMVSPSSQAALNGAHFTTTHTTTWNIKKEGTASSLRFWRAAHVGIGCLALYSYTKTIPSAAITGTIGLGTNAIGLHGVSLVPWTLTAGLLTVPGVVAVCSYRKFKRAGECLDCYNPNPVLSNGNEGWKNQGDFFAVKKVSTTASPQGPRFEQRTPSCPVDLNMN